MNGNDGSKTTLSKQIAHWIIHSVIKTGIYVCVCVCVKMFWWSPEDEGELRKCPQNQSEFPHFQADLVSWSGSGRSFSPHHLPVNPRFRRYRGDWSQAASTVPIPKWLQILCRKTCKGGCFWPPFSLKMGRAQETEDSLGAWEVTENSRSKQPVWTRSNREATVNTGRKEGVFLLLYFTIQSWGQPEN